MNFSLTTMANNAKINIVKHSPEILTGLGIAGFCSAVCFAIKATPLAVDAIEAKKEELEKEKLDLKETVTTTWKYYIPVAGLMIASSACIIGGQTVNAKRNAALATAYGLSEAAFKEYKDKVVETIGEKKEQAIQEDIYKDRVEREQAPYIYSTGFGEFLCYDFMSGRYFRCDINKIDQAYKNVAELISEDDSAALNEFYYELNLPATGAGMVLGWNSQMLPRDSYGRCVLEQSTSTQKSIGGEPCLVLNFVVNPIAKYDDHH